MWNCYSYSQADACERRGEDPAVDKPIAQKISEFDPDITVIAPDGYTRNAKLKEKRAGLIGSEGNYGLVGLRSPPNPETLIQEKNEAGWITYKKGKKVSKLVVGADIDIGETVKRGKKIKFDKKEIVK